MRLVIASSLSAVLALQGCGQNFGTPHSASSLGPSIGSALGQVVAGELGLDPNQGGSADALHIRGVSWGRLADVYDRDPETGRARPQAYDLVIGEDLVSDGRDYSVEMQPILNKVRVTILHERGTPAYADAYRRLDQGLVPIAEKSSDPSELPPFSMVPRDAAIVVVFDDLLDPASIRAESVRISVGSGSDTIAARVLPDANHGAYAEVDGVTRFYPTRVILDPTVSLLEALESDQPLPENSMGLPASTSTGRANCALRISTAVSDPDSDLPHLRNLAGHGLDIASNGPIEMSGSSSQIVRAFRSGGSTAVTGDAYNGFLAALTQPRVVGNQDAVVDAVSPDPLGGVGDFVIGLTLAVPTCAHAARIGDVIQQPAGWAEVVVASAAPVNGKLTHVRVHMILGNTLIPSAASYLTIYDPVADATREACFVRIRTAPLSPPDAGVDPRAEYALKFSQPMDAASLTALSNFTLTRTASNAHPDELVPAETRANGGLDEFRLRPVLPLAHLFSQAETYYVHLAGGPEGVKSSSGAELAAAFPTVSITLDPLAAAQTTGGYALTFASVDEDQNGAPEIRGQFLQDLPQSSIRARPVSRYAAVADRTQAVPGVMAAFGPGAQVPLVPLGCRLQTVWRYCDVGMALSDESNFNVDVEGLDWSPVGGTVIADHFSQFEIRLAHSGFLPDEALEATLLPSYPLSGLATIFASNPLDPVHDPLKVVHPRQLGYDVNPADQFSSSTGTPMMPYPLNRTIPPDQFQYYTWRDTALQAHGAPNGTGAELAIVTQVQGSGIPGQPYAVGQVPSIGLPLLMEFDCFSDAGALGLNTFDVSLALNSSPTPNFRAFSSGGVNSSGQVVSVDPDASPVATGGFNPSSNPPGAATLPAENTFYIGQMDLVVRVSRLNTVWIDTASANPSYAATAVLEPKPADQPTGTQVVLAYRGASSVSPALVSSALTLDAYGDPLSPADSVAYFNADSSWKSSIALLDGARFVELRATLVSNARSGAIPSISGLGIAFTRH